MRFFAGWKLSNWLSVEQQPVKAIGLLGSTLLLSVCIAFSQVDQSEAEHELAFDEMLCERFGGNLCMHSARLSSKDEQILDQIEKFCGNLTQSLLDSEPCYLKVARFFGDVEAAFSVWRRGCIAGRYEACRYVGWMYATGRGVPHDDDRAVELLREACDGGDSSGCFELNRMYRYGRGIKNDDAYANELFKSDCERGSSNACMRLARITSDLNTSDKLYRKALSISSKYCEKDDGVSCSRVADQYRKGLGVQIDAAEAKAFYFQACGLELYTACFDLMFYYDERVGRFPEIEASIVHYRERCGDGDPLDCASLGHLYEKFISHTTVGDDMFELFKEGCEGGIDCACKALHLLSEQD